MRRFDFLRRIGNEQKLAWRIRKRSNNFLVAFLLGFGSHAGVEENGDVRRQIAGRRSAKQVLLREDTSRRVDANDFFLSPPAFESNRYIRKHFTVQFPASESMLPDFSFERLQGPAFAIPDDQPLAVSHA